MCGIFKVSTHKIMSSANRNHSTSSFLILMPFISFSCQTALARISSIVLHRSSGSEHPCLIPDIRGKVFNHLAVSCGLVTHGFYYAKVHFCYTQFVERFYDERILNFSFY